MQNLVSLENEILEYTVQLQFPATNNEIEYKTLITGLKLAKSIEINNLIVHSDSHRVMRQVNGEYDEAIEEWMKIYVNIVH